jgi:hypothetical protein
LACEGEERERMRAIRADSTRNICTDELRELQDPVQWPALPQPLRGVLPAPLPGLRAVPLRHARIEHFDDIELDLFERIRQTERTSVPS